MKKKFFITTPIYYANSVPHIGHAYSSLIADVIARYKRDNWFDVKFSTWVDENWQKMVNAAKEKWISIMEFLDDIATKQKAVWDWIDISYTDFIRTTELRHHEFVSKVLQKTYEAWDIYKWEYEWLYCVWCEAFKKETDLTPDWLCPDHLKKPEHIKEKNYFFKLSKYQKQLEDFYLNNPDFTIPNNRFKEMQSFLKEWLEDFSISRETNKFWIPLPFDPSQVTYVWYDALLNYLTVCQNWAEDFWPA
ncbi:MAG: methionyl-tRNA synthetase alpha subunit, partial [uncultured bacterium (gcode 4)]